MALPFDPLSTLESAFDLGKTAISRIWPDPLQQAIELRKLEELRQTGKLAELSAEVKLLLGQLSINEEEAKNPSLFVAGWRPAVGWICVMALGYQYGLHPLLSWFLEVPDVAQADLAMLMPILVGLLGLRSWEKNSGISTSSMRGKKSNE